MAGMPRQTEPGSIIGGEDMAEETQNVCDDNPLHRRLGLRPGLKGVVVGPADGDDHPLAPLPEGTVLVGQADDLESTNDQLDYIHFFAQNRADLTRQFSLLRDRLAPGGVFWISWIRQSSARRGGGLPADLNENVIRRLALTSGLVDVKVAPLDQEWAALKLVHRKH